MLNDALPVAIDLADDDLAAEVAAHVESHLGWQVIEPGPHLPVRLFLADGVRRGTPTVVVVRDLTYARQHLRDGASEVIQWPQESARLAELVPDEPVRQPAKTVLVVAGTTRQTGTSTVALALGAICAWRGSRTTVVTDLEGCRMAGSPSGGLVAGVEGLEVSDRNAAQLGAQSADVAVVDRGVGVGHVMVAAADHALFRGTGEMSEDTVVILRGRGGMHAHERHRLLGERRTVLLPESFRVARAGLLGRVPIGLPGSYLELIGRALSATTSARQVAA